MRRNTCSAASSSNARGEQRNRSLASRSFGKRPAAAAAGVWGYDDPHRRLQRGCDQQGNARARAAFSSAWSSCGRPTLPDPDSANPMGTPSAFFFGDLAVACAAGTLVVVNIRRGYWAFTALLCRYSAGVFFFFLVILLSCSFTKNQRKHASIVLRVFSEYLG